MTAPFPLDRVASNSLKPIHGESSVTLRDSDVVIFNEGAWWSRLKLSKLMPKELDVERSFRNAASLMASALSNMTEVRRIVWRSILPGHPHCHVNTTKRDPQLFSWHQFMARNEFLRELASLHGHYYLDLWRLFYERQNMHSGRDCLHWCIGRGSILFDAAFMILKFYEVLLEEGVKIH